MVQVAVRAILIYFLRAKVGYFLCARVNRQRRLIVENLSKNLLYRCMYQYLIKVQLVYTCMLIVYIVTTKAIQSFCYLFMKKETKMKISVVLVRCFIMQPNALILCMQIKFSLMS